MFYYNKDQTVKVRASDIAIACFVLGMAIDRHIKDGFAESALLKDKHSYLRLRNALINISNRPPQEFQARGVLLRSLAKEGKGLKPDWLPCNSAQSLLHSQPCSRRGEVCRCAQLLQCELDNVSEDDVS